jgi:hypothetical protein
MLGKKTGGRQRGTKNKRTEQIEAQLAAVTAKATAEAATLTPLDLMLSILRNPDIAMRADMAKAAAPYCHARLQAIEQTTTAKIELEPVPPPLTPPEIAEGIRALLIENAERMGVSLPAGASNAERLGAIMNSGQPPTPEMFRIMRGNVNDE